MSTTSCHPRASIGVLVSRIWMRWTFVWYVTTGDASSRHSRHGICMFAVPGLTLDVKSGSETSGVATAKYGLEQVAFNFIHCSL